MSGILSTIIGRHVHPENPINPRPKGLFEQDHFTSELVAPPVQAVAEQEPSQTETTLSTKNDPGNALEKVGNPNSNSPLVDGSVSNKSKPENKLPTLDPATGKKTNPIVSKINVPENTDNKPNQEGIPSPNTSHSTKVRSNKNQSPDQTPATRLRDGIHQDPKKSPSSILDLPPKEEAKPVAAVSKVSTNHKEPQPRSTAFPQNFDSIPEPITDKTAANPRVKRELQNAIYLQQKNVGNREYSSLKNENKQAPPTIKITIGRIEIKAINPQKSTIQKNREPSKARISLNDFLDKKENY
jgi:hypothetical protein